MILRRLLPALVLMMTVVPAASAHRPDWGSADGVTEIADLHTSWAFYRDLREAGQVDVYTFTAQPGDNLHAGINIPAVRGLEAYGVSVALLGPGLPTARPTALPLEIPAGLGAIIFPSQPGEDFFEPFTQTRHWGRQRIDLALMRGGEYYLAVWRPDGAPGKYVLDVGTAEVFGPADLFRFPIWWVRVHVFFGHAPYLTAAGLAALALGALGIAHRRHSLKLRGGAPA